MKKHFIVPYEESVQYFIKLKNTFIENSDTIVIPDAEFIKLIEADKVERTNLVFAFDRRVYKIVTDNMMALFSINVASNGVKYIRDFYIKENGIETCKISNLIYKDNDSIRIPF